MPLLSSVHPTGAGVPDATDVVKLDVISDKDDVPESTVVVGTMSVPGRDTEVVVAGALPSGSDTERVAPAETGLAVNTTHTAMPLSLAVQPDGSAEPDAIEVVYVVSMSVDDTVTGRDTSVGIPVTVTGIVAVVGRNVVRGTSVALSGSDTVIVTPPDTRVADTSAHTATPAPLSVQPDGSAEPETGTVTGVVLDRGEVTAVAEGTSDMDTLVVAMVPSEIEAETVAPPEEAVTVTHAARPSASDVHPGARVAPDEAGDGVAPEQ